MIGGSCLCGAIRFEIDGSPGPLSHCHCSMCRKSHGAGYVTWVGFEASRVSITHGEDLLNWFDSSPGAQRGFCRDCGSSLFFRSERWAGELHIALGCMDGPIDRQPQANVFFDSHVDWMPIDASLKQVDG